MSDPVSFFYRRDRIPATTYAFTLTVSAKETFRFFVCANERLRGPLVRDASLARAEQHQGCVAELTTALAAKGGLFVVLTESGNRWAVRFHIVEGQRSKSAPGTFLEVELGHPPRIRQIEASEQTVRAGSHLVVPVDGESEEQLGVFRDSLSWLPEDLEAVVLGALVRPSLEERVVRLEDRLLGRTAARRTRAASQGSAMLSRLADGWFWARKPVLLGCLVLLLGWGYLTLERRSEGGSDQDDTLPAATPDAGGETAPAAATPGEAPAGDAAKADFAEGVEKVLEAVKKKGEALPALEALYRRHFAAYADSGDKHAELTRILSGDSDELLFGLIKLQLIQLNRDIRDFTFLTRAGNLDETENVAKGIAGKDRVADGPNQNMIAALSCIRWRIPALGGTAFGPSGRACADYDLAKALPGVKALPEFVKNFTPARNQGTGASTGVPAPAPATTVPPVTTESPAPMASPEPTGSPAGGGG